jgi:DNA replication protein DnaC
MYEWHECPKCGGPLGPQSIRGPSRREPWCDSCQRKYRDEYPSVRSEWVFKNARGLLQEAGVPMAYQSCRFENFEVDDKDQRRTLGAVKRWSNESDEDGLFLCGGCGTGKTHLAVAALLAMRAQGLTCQFTSVQELLVQCRDSFRNNKGLEDVLGDVCSFEALLLDDLGTENPTQFSRETIAFLIDRAYRNQRTVIVTSNYDLEALAERLDGRSVDRLIETCLPVKFSGQSYRQKLARHRTNVRNLPASETVQ